MYLLDTNICIYAIKKRPKKAIKNIYNNLSKGLYLSTLTVAELEFGVSNSSFPEKNRIALLEFLSIFNLLPFDDRDAIEYGLIRTDLKKKGTPIGTIDTLLAAQARAKELILVTNNLNEFRRVNNLRLKDWSV